MFIAKLIMGVVVLGVELLMFLSMVILPPIALSGRGYSERKHRGCTNDPNCKFSHIDLHHCLGNMGVDG